MLIIDLHHPPGTSAQRQPDLRQPDQGQNDEDDPDHHDPAAGRVGFEPAPNLDRERIPGLGRRSWRLVGTRLHTFIVCSTPLFRKPIV